MKPLLIMLVVACAACDSDLPPAEEGLRVVGEVTYAGNAQAAYARPAVLVSLFTEFPPMSPPRGTVAIESPSFGAAIPFEIVGVPAGSYKIAAQVIDLDVASSTGAPTGSYPSYCALLAPVANITVQNDTPTTGLNMVIYDAGGDPCLRMPL